MFRFRSQLKPHRYRRLIPAVLVLLLIMTTSGALAQGGTISYGTTVIGTVSANSPLAFYTFTGAEGDLVTVLLIGITPGMTPAVSLNSPTQQQLSFSTDDPFGSGDGAEVRLTHRLPQAGIYTLLISNTSATPGDFLLRLTGRPATETPETGPGLPPTITFPPGAPAQTYIIPGSPDEPTPLEPIRKIGKMVICGRNGSQKGDSNDERARFWRGS